MTSHPPPGAYRRRSLPTVAMDPMSISVIRLAAKTLGAPSATACQLTTERQPKTPQSIKVIASAIHLAKLNPLARRSPQTTERPPKREPDEGSFGSGGIGEIACESAEKEENSKRNKPAGVSHVLVDSKARRSRNGDCYTQNARRKVSRGSLGRGATAWRPWTDRR